MTMATNRRGKLFGRILGDLNRDLNRDLKDHLRAYGAIIFVPSPRVGAVLLALGFLHPNVALSGLIAVSSLLLMGGVLGIGRGRLSSPYMIYNPLLVGMSIGAIFKLDATVCFFIATAAILTFMATMVMEFFLPPERTPLLSLPFAVVSTLVYLGASNYSNLFSIYYYDFSMFTGLEKVMPHFLSAFFKACGTILFMPNVVSGMVVFMAMVVHSRLMSFWGIAAFSLGTAIHGSFLGSLDLALANPYSFNYLLVGLALGGTFLVSSLRTGAVLCMGVSISVLLVGGSTAIAELYRIPVFTLPFNCTVISFILALKLAGFEESLFIQRSNPEESVTHALNFKRRFMAGEPSIGIPLAGEVTIMQGFDGELTHKGKWRHALDLIVEKEGKSFAGSGAAADQYLAFGKQVFAPVSGHVVACRSDLPDNQMGKLDHVNNWGNYVILRSSEGFFVELSHFMQNSLTVAAGQWVNEGDSIGRIGNSGYSFQPHLHLQVQRTGFLGDETQPFNFGCFGRKGEMVFSKVPRQGETITSPEIDTRLYNRLVFILGTFHAFTWSDGRGREYPFNLEVCRSQDVLGLFYLDDGMGGKLYFTTRHGVFYYYDFFGGDDSPLRLFMAAMPRFPLSSSVGLPWRDSIPIDVFCRGILRGTAQFAAGFSLPVDVDGTWIYDRNADEVRGTIRGLGRSIETLLRFEASSGVSLIRVGDETIMKRETKL